MTFQKEPMTDEAIAIIEAAFEKAQNSHINLIRRRTDTLDKEKSKGWVVDGETGDFLIAGSGIPCSIERYYYYYNGQLFNIVIRGVYYGGVVQRINSIDCEKRDNISQGFMDKLIEAFRVLEKDSQRGGKLTFGVEH